MIKKPAFGCDLISQFGIEPSPRHAAWNVLPETAALRGTLRMKIDFQFAVQQRRLSIAGLIGVAPVNPPHPDPLPSRGEGGEQCCHGP